MINYKSNVVKFNPYVAQLPVETIGKVGAFKQESYDANRQAIGNAIDTLNNLPSLAGADTEMKNKMITDITKNINEIGKLDYSKPEVMSQIQNYINQYTNSPDIQGIVQRAYKKQELVDKYKELTKTGKSLDPWDMEGLNEIVNYENSGKYIRNKQFNGDVFDSPDLSKTYQDTFKNMEADLITKGEIVNGWRYNNSIKEKSLEKIKAATRNAILTNPQLRSSFQRRADYNLNQNGKTAAKVYQEDLDDKIATDLAVLEKASYTRQYVKDKAQLAYIDSLINERKNSIRDLQNRKYALDSPGADYIAKDWLVEDMIDKSVGDFANAFQYKESKLEADQYGLKAAEHLYNLDEIEAKAAIDYKYDLQRQEAGIGKEGEKTISFLQGIASSLKSGQKEDGIEKWTLNSPQLFNGKAFNKQLYDVSGNLVKDIAPNEVKFRVYKGKPIIDLYYPAAKQSGDTKNYMQSIDLYDLPQILLQSGNASQAKILQNDIYKIQHNYNGDVKKYMEDLSRNSFLNTQNNSTPESTKANENNYIEFPQ